MRSTLFKSLLVVSAASFTAAFPFPSFSDRSNEPVKRWAKKKVASAFYTEWNADRLPLDKVSWKKYTNLYFAYLPTRPDPTNVTFSDEDSSLLKAYVQKAHDQGVQASLSVAGWDDSIHFSTNVGDEKNRTAYANALLKVVDDYNLDGLDFNWLYPGRQGSGCNKVSPKDTANYLAFLQLLRKQCNKSLLLTVSADTSPFDDETGHPSKDLSDFAKVLDWITIEAYDFWGSLWSDRVGPNAPLFDSCAPEEYQNGSGDGAVKAWIGTGIPSDQIVFGVAAYGHAYTIKQEDAIKNGQLVPYPPFDQNTHQPGDETSTPAGPNNCGVVNPPDDTWNFWALIKDGLLQQDGEPASGVPYRFDDCSKTTFIYRNKTGVEISYDAPVTFAEKGKYIQDNGLLGFSLWEAAGDYNDILLDTIRESAGF